MRLLALDIGMRRTGVAYFDSDTGIPLPLDTLTHTSKQELRDAVMQIVRERKIDRVIVGLPKLPSGEEGEQSQIVRSYAQLLQEAGCTVEFFDERYTTPKTSKSDKNYAKSTPIGDGDAAAACEILRIATKS